MKGWRSRATALLLGAAAALPAGAGPLFSAYKDITQGFDRETFRIRLDIDGATPPAAISLAFASGECGAEHWAGLDAERLVRANLPRLAQAGQRYIVSTGGEAGVFTCGSEAGMQRFVERYLSAGLVGFDFDIEGKQTGAQIDDLVRHAAAAQRRWPALQFSFTLATHAGSDGRQQGLNATGEQVMRALRRHHFDSAIVNLMVMNYGPASAQFCVLRKADGRCDMGRSGLQAARNLAAKHGWPLARTAVTAMIGVNDVVDNVTTVDDARQLARDVRDAGLAGLHYWSLDRDRPCAGGGARADCSSLPGGAALAFARAFGEGLKSR